MPEKRKQVNEPRTDFHYIKQSRVATLPGFSDANLFIARRNESTKPRLNLSVHGLNDFSHCNNDRCNTLVNVVLIVIKCGRITGVGGGAGR